MSPQTTADVLVTQADLDWFERIAPTLTWTYAKTMPDAPHSYVVRGKTMDEEDFVRAVRVIRTFGEPGKFYSRVNVYLTIGNTKWWTMGAPIDETIIINMADTEKTYGVQNAVHTASGRFTIYDALATAYDSRYDDAACHLENEAIRKLIAKEFGAYAPKTLDVGCGTGLLLDLKLTAAGIYTGIDPSQGMLNELVRKHTKVTHLVPATFEDAYAQIQDQRFDLVASLFGSPSYIAPEYIARMPSLLRKGGVLVMMHYRDGYLPDYEADDAQLMVRTAASREAALDIVRANPDRARALRLNDMIVTVFRG